MSIKFDHHLIPSIVGSFSASAIVKYTIYCGVLYTLVIVDQIITHDLPFIYAPISCKHFSEIASMLPTFTVCVKQDWGISLIMFSI